MESKDGQRKKPDGEHKVKGDQDKNKSKGQTFCFGREGNRFCLVRVFFLQYVVQDFESVGFGFGKVILILRQRERLDFDDDHHYSR